jgi:endo-1,3-1,4-beta-glycanase ExoK
MKRKITAFLIFATSTLLVAQKPYTAGEIQSLSEVKYGRFEMSMYSSDVSGTTSTFFLWKNGGETSTSRWNEIDIETFGKNPTRWQSNPIWEYTDTDQNIKRWEGYHDGLQIANTWVTFGLEWTPNYIAWFNNGTEVRRIIKGQNAPSGTDPVGNISDAMRMCFNHWSAFSVAWLGPFSAADLPSYQFVDWLTYQAWNGTGFDTVSIRHDFNTIQEVRRNYAISTHTFGDNRCDFSRSAVGVVNGYLWLGIFTAGQERAPLAEIPTGLDEAQSSDLFSISPQPFTTSTTLNLKMGSSIETINIYNSEGKLVETVKGDNSGKITFGNELTNGLYHLQINSNNGVYGAKVLKQ